MESAILEGARIIATAIAQAAGGIVLAIYIGMIVRAIFNN